RSVARSAGPSSSTPTRRRRSCASSASRTSTRYSSAPSTTRPRPPTRMRERWPALTPLDVRMLRALERAGVNVWRTRAQLAAELDEDTRTLLPGLSWMSRREPGLIARYYELGQETRYTLTSRGSRYLTDVDQLRLVA